MGKDVRVMKMEGQSNMGESNPLKRKEGKRDREWRVHGGIEYLVAEAKKERETKIGERGIRGKEH